MGLLSVEGVVAGYSAADEVLKGVDLEVGPGEIVSVIGPNGAGKSTLLKVIAGVLAPSRGHVRLGDAPIDGPAAARDQRAAVWPSCPRSATSSPPCPCARTSRWAAISTPPTPAGVSRGSSGASRCSAERRRHAARTLSGGQRQILAMAMALMVEPSLLLLDEPSAGLAPMAAERLFETIGAINRDGVAIVMVEQNALEALAIAARGYILVDGRNSRTGAAAALAADPDVRRIFLGG